MCSNKTITLIFNNLYCGFTKPEIIIQSIFNWIVPDFLWFNVNTALLEKTLSMTFTGWLHVNKQTLESTMCAELSAPLVKVSSDPLLECYLTLLACWNIIKILSNEWTMRVLDCVKPRMPFSSRDINIRLLSNLRAKLNRDMLGLIIRGFFCVNEGHDLVKYRMHFTFSSFPSCWHNQRKVIWGCRLAVVVVVCILQQHQMNTPGRRHVLHVNNRHYVHFKADTSCYNVL